MGRQKYINILIKPASSICNMQCRYCFYNDVAMHRACKGKGIIDSATTSAVIDKALALSETAIITFAFQGGEPTLAGLSFFEAFVEEVNKKRKGQEIRYSIQTNGLAIDRAWVNFFRQNAFLVGLSIDGPAEFNDSFRIDLSGLGTYKRILTVLRLLQKCDVRVNVLTVLTEKLARHPQSVWKWICKESIDYVQFIPCLPGLDESKNVWALTPETFAQFYKRIFDLWENNLFTGTYRSIWLFENMLQLAGGLFPSQCGMLGKCSPQIIVESNGDIYPCDFYALDVYRIGNINEISLEEYAKSPILAQFLSEPRRSCTKCTDCPYEQVCHRNCKRLSIAYYNDTYCGLRSLYEYSYARINRIAQVFPVATKDTF